MVKNFIYDEAKKLYYSYNEEFNILFPKKKKNCEIKILKKWNKRKGSHCINYRKLNLQLIFIYYPEINTVYI